MYILIDVGGTKTRIAGSTDLSKFGEPIVIDTPQSYGEGISAIVARAKDISGGAEIRALSAGLPVMLCKDKRSIWNAKNLPDWSKKDIANDLEKALGTKTYFDNDVAVIGLGEALFGAGIGASIIVYLTVSTGVNGVRVADGVIDPATFSFSIGNQILSTDSSYTRWEDLISGAALQKKYGKPPRDMGKEWDGWDELARLTAIGLHNAILHWSPERIILGGSMFKEIGIPVEGVKKHIASMMLAHPELPEIVHSKLGDFGGLYGGLARLKQLQA